MATANKRKNKMLTITFRTNILGIDADVEASYTGEYVPQTHEEPASLPTVEEISAWSSASGEFFENLEDYFVNEDNQQVSLYEVLVNEANEHIMEA